jgi:hypothetical protein
VFQLIVSGVYVTEDEDDAKKKFKEYTGVDFDEYAARLKADENVTTEEILDDYDQTKIFEFDALKGTGEIKFTLKPVKHKGHRQREFTFTHVK